VCCTVVLLVYLGWQEITREYDHEHAALLDSLGARIGGPAFLRRDFAV